MTVRLTSSIQEQQNMKKGNITAYNGRKILNKQRLTSENLNIAHTIFKFNWVYEYSFLSAKHLNIYNYIPMSVSVAFGIVFLDSIWQQMDEKYRKAYVINALLLALINFFILEFNCCFGAIFNS